MISDKYIYYDGEDRRIWREKLDKDENRISLEKYVLSGDNVAADLDENDNVTARYFTNGVDNIIYVERKLSGEWKKYYYHTNHLGSVVAITDEDGDIVNKYNYTDSWGSFERTCPSETIGKPCIPNRYTYTGREWDADAQLYHYRARWYDPEIKRFMQEDPKRSLNQYVYVNNHPILFVDATGHEADVPQFTDEEELDAVKEVISKNSSNEEIAIFYTMYLWGEHNDLFFGQQNMETIFGNTDMDWAMTLSFCYYKSGGIPPYISYLPGKTVWGIFDDFPVHFKSMGNDAEMNAIMFSMALTANIPFSDLFKYNKDLSQNHLGTPRGMY